MYGAWDPSLVTELLSHMTPEACRIDMQTRDYDSLAAKIKKVCCPCFPPSARQPSTQDEGFYRSHHLLPYPSQLGGRTDVEAGPM